MDEAPSDLVLLIGKLKSLSNSYGKDVHEVRGPHAFYSSSYFSIQK